MVEETDIYTTQCAVYTLDRIHSAHYTSQTTQYKIHSTEYTLHSIQNRLHTTQYIVQRTHYTGHYM